MCSYNAINGKPTCADPWLLQDVARDAWGFDGYITSDCGAESDVFINHHYTNTPEESVQKILAAGTPGVIPDCHFSVQLNHFIPGFLSYSVAVFFESDNRISP